MAKTQIELPLSTTALTLQEYLLLEEKFKLLTELNALAASETLCQTLLEAPHLSATTFDMILAFLLKQKDPAPSESLIFSLTKAPFHLAYDDLAALFSKTSEKKRSEILITTHELAFERSESFLPGTQAIYKNRFDFWLTIFLCNAGNQYFINGHLNLSNAMLLKRLNSANLGRTEENLLLKNLLDNNSAYNWTDETFQEIAMSRLKTLFAGLSLPDIIQLSEPVLNPQSSVFIAFFDNLIRTNPDQNSGMVLRLLSGDNEKPTPQLIVAFMMQSQWIHLEIYTTLLKRLDLKSQLEMGQKFFEKFHSSTHEDSELRKVYIDNIGQKIKGFKNKATPEEQKETLQADLHALSSIILSLKQKNQSRVVQAFFEAFDNNSQLTFYFLRELWDKKYPKRELMKPLREITRRIPARGQIMLLKKFELSLIKIYFDYLLICKADAKEFELYLDLARESGNENLLMELLQDVVWVPETFFKEAIKQISNEQLLTLLNALINKADNQIQYQEQLTQTLIAFCDKFYDTGRDPVDAIQTSSLLPDEQKVLVLSLLKSPKCLAILTKRGTMALVDKFFQKVNINTSFAQFKPASIFNCYALNKETWDKIALNLIAAYQPKPIELKNFFNSLIGSSQNLNEIGRENYQIFMKSCYSILTHNQPKNLPECIDFFQKTTITDFTPFNLYLLNKLLSNNPDISLGIQYITNMPVIPADSRIPRKFLVQILLHSKSEATEGNWKKIAHFVADFSVQEAPGFFAILIEQAQTESPDIFRKVSSFITNSRHFPGILFALSQAEIEWIIKNSHPEIVENTFLNWLPHFASRKDINFSRILALLPEKKAFLETVFISLTFCIHKIFNQIMNEANPGAIYVRLLDAQLNKARDEEKLEFIAQIHSHWIDQAVPFHVASFLTKIFLSIQSLDLSKTVDKNIFFEQIKFNFQISESEQKNRLLAPLLPLLFTHKNWLIDKELLKPAGFQVILMALIRTMPADNDSSNLAYLFSLLENHNQKAFAMQCFVEGKFETLTWPFLCLAGQEIDLVDIYSYYQKNPAPVLVVLMARHGQGMECLTELQQGEILRKLGTNDQLSLILADSNRESARLDFVSSLYSWLEKNNRNIGEWLNQIQQLTGPNLIRLANFTQKSENTKALSQAMEDNYHLNHMINLYFHAPEAGFRINQDGWLYTRLLNSWSDISKFTCPHQSLFSFLKAEDAVRALIDQSRLYMALHKLEKFFQPLSGEEPEKRLIAARWMHRLPLLGIWLEILKDPQLNPDLKTRIENLSIHNLINRLPELIGNYLKHFPDKDSRAWQSLYRPWQEYQLQKSLIEQYAAPFNPMINNANGLVSLNSFGEPNALSRDDKAKLELALHNQSAQIGHKLQAAQTALQGLFTQALEIKGILECELFQDWLFEMGLFSPMADSLDAQALLLKLKPLVFTEKMLNLESRLQTWKSIYHALGELPEQTTVRHFLTGFALPIQADDILEHQLNFGLVDPAIKGLAATEKDLLQVIEALSFAHSPYLGLFYQFLLAAKKSKLPEDKLLALSLEDLAGHHETTWLKNEIAQLDTAFIQKIEERRCELLRLQFNYAEDSFDGWRLQSLGHFLSEKNCSTLANCLSSFDPAFSKEENVFTQHFQTFFETHQKSRFFPMLVRLLQPSLIENFVKGLLAQNSINRPLLILLIEYGFEKICLKRLNMAMIQLLHHKDETDDKPYFHFEELQTEDFARYPHKTLMKMLEIQHLIYYITPLPLGGEIAATSGLPGLDADASLLEHIIAFFDPGFHSFIKKKDGNPEQSLAEDCYQYLFKNNSFVQYCIHLTTAAEKSPESRLHFARLFAFMRQNPEYLLGVFLDWIEKEPGSKQEFTALKELFLTMLRFIPVDQVALALMAKPEAHGVFQSCLENWTLNPNLLVQLFKRLPQGSLKTFLVMHLLSRKDYCHHLPAKSFLTQLQDPTNKYCSRLKSLVHFIDLDCLSMDKLEALSIEAAATLFCSVKHFPQLDGKKMELLLQILSPAFETLLPYWFKHFTNMPNAIFPLCALINHYPAEFEAYYALLSEAQKGKLLTAILENTSLLTTTSRHLCQLLAPGADESHFTKVLNFYRNHADKHLKEWIIQISLSLVHQKKPMTENSLRSLISLAERKEFRELKAGLETIDNRLVGADNLFNNCDIFYDNDCPNVARMKKAFPVEKGEKSLMGQFKSLLGLGSRKKAKAADPAAESALIYFIKRYKGSLAALSVCVDAYLDSFDTSVDAADNYYLGKTASLLNNPAINVALADMLGTCFLDHLPVWSMETAIELLKFDAAKVLKFVGKNNNYEKLIDFCQIVYPALDAYPDLQALVGQAFEEAVLEANLRDNSSCFRGLTAWYDRCCLYGWSGFFSPNQPTFVKPFDEIDAGDSTQVMLDDLKSTRTKAPKTPTFASLLQSRPRPLTKSWLKAFHSLLSEKEDQFQHEDLQAAPVREAIEDIFQGIQNDPHKSDLNKWIARLQPLFLVNRDRLTAVYAFHREDKALEKFLQKINRQDLLQEMFEVEMPASIPQSRMRKTKDTNGMEKDRDYSLENTKSGFFESFSLETLEKAETIFTKLSDMAQTYL